MINNKENIMINLMLAKDTYKKLKWLSGYLATPMSSIMRYAITQEVNDYIRKYDLKI